MSTNIAPAGEAGGGAVLSALSPSDIHVLLVDDERLTRLVVGNLLRTCKYKVTIAESGTQAMDVLSKAGPGAFQLIMTDVMMPDVGGLELLRFVRSHQHLYNVPVIMMSASEAQETMCAALLGSADEYLVKPVTRKEVQNIWMHVMKRYHNAAAQPAAAAAAAAQPAGAVEILMDPAAAAAAAAIAAAAGGGSAGLVPLAGHAGGAAAGDGSGPLPRVPLLSLGLGGAGSLGLSPEVARDMMRAAALAASTTAAGGGGGGGTAPAVALPSGLLEEEQAPAALPEGVSAAVALTASAAGLGVHAGGPSSAPCVEGSERKATAAAAAGADGGVSTPKPDTQQQQQQPCSRQTALTTAHARQPHAGCPGHTAAAEASARGLTGAAGDGGGGGGNSGSGHGASKVNLLKWLRRANRCVQPKESFWIFCEVLLLLDTCQAAAARPRACGLRPSKLVLYNNGRVAFAPTAPPPPLSAAAAAAATSCGSGGGGKGADGDGGGGGMDARKKRRRQSGGQSRSPEEGQTVAAAPAAAGGGAGGADGDQPAKGQPAAQAANGAPPSLVLGPVAAAAATPAEGMAAVAVGASEATAASLVQPPMRPPAAVAASADDDEDALYRSPEEALGQPATPASDMFSLGLLFFELFYVCAGQERAAVLRDARQRLLPASFGRQQPKEAAFALALLHPEPACRPTLEELLGSAMFRATCTSLRQRGQRQQQAGKGGAATLAAAPGSGRDAQQHHHHNYHHHHLHHHNYHHHHRHTNHNRQPPTAQQQRGIGTVEAGGGAGAAAKQLQHPQQHPQQQTPNPHRLASRSCAAAGSAPAEAAAGKPPAEVAVVATAAMPSAAPAATAAALGSPSTGSPGGSLRVDDAVLLEFLRMLRKRKLEELAQVGSELAFLTADAQMVEQYLLYMHQTRTVKRQRAGGGGGGGGGGGAGAMPPPPTPLSSSNAHPPQPAVGRNTEAMAAAAAAAAVGSAEAGLTASGRGTGGAAHGDGGGGVLQVTTSPATAAAAATPAGGGGGTVVVAPTAAAAAGSVRHVPLPHSAAWSEQHQAARSKWCRVVHKYEQLEAVFMERRRPALSPPPASPRLEAVGGLGPQPQPAAAAAPPPPHGVPSMAPRPPPPPPASAAARRHADAGGLPEPLLRFAEDLSAFATFTTLTPVASLRYAEPPTSSSMVAGASFDRDDEFFAVAGVSKRIKIYEREAVLQSHIIGAHYPVLEISSRSRLSSVTWSGYIKGHLASADYEGVVQLWDANTNSELMQFEEHRKRVWSIDFSQADPARLLSGGDDGCVKLWSIQQDTSVATVDLRANVCSVHFSPTSPHLFAAGCANYRIFLYDIRNTARALAVLPGHTRAVSYVRFLSPSLLVSASTDNTLRLWQLDGLAAGGAGTSTAGGTADGSSCVQVFRGHLNERNFTGLSVSPDGYICCGSENNRVFCYYQSLPMPVTSYDFSAPDPIHGSGGVAGGGGGGLDGAGGGAGLGTAAAGGGAGPGGGGGVGGIGGGASGADWTGGAGSGSGPGSGQFVSSVCWSRRSNLLLAANSVGLIKLFTLN